MAKIKFPLMSAEVRGKFGDIVFTKRYGKQIARISTKPRNPNTVKQQAVRHNMSALSLIWKGQTAIVKKYDATNNTFVDVSVNGLTDAERQAWKNYMTRLHKPMTLARTVFIGDNIKRLQSGSDVLRVPA